MNKTFIVLIVCLTFMSMLHAQQYSYPEMSGKKPGMALLDSESTGVVVEFSVPEFTMEDVKVEGRMMKSVQLPGTFLFNEEGMPNLPGKGGFIAIPRGSTPRLKIVSAKTELIPMVDLAPAPRIPLDNEPGPLEFKRNQVVYSKNEFFPALPAILSETEIFRGIDVVTLGITPFQYNPVTRDLLVYKELRVEVDFEGGNGRFGDPAFRNRWWDPILSDNLMNYMILPRVDYDGRLTQLQDNPLNDECEYIIICPNSAAHQAWADTIRRFRTEQGILTKVFPLNTIGGNNTATIEAFIDNAYNNWTLKPVACLLLGDYGTDPSNHILSPLLPHYSSGYNDFASDNQYADVTGDDLPDVVFSRIAANDASQLEIMCTKFLNHERNPPVDPNFYDKPVTALGWQTERWFQLCAEIVGGYFRESENKHPRRINEIYEGSPGSVWSDAVNTNTIVNYFGPAGLGYIPQQPSSMPCCWTGGTAVRVNQAIDSGAFMVMHRDHGSYTTWGEPDYSTYWAQQLVNTNLTYIFTINCQTGAYHRSSDCLGEKFHRQFKNGHNAGSLGFIAPTEVSYSFVNDTFVWGLMDNLWPDFMPSEYTTPESRNILPAFGNAAGKYFLHRSSWPAVSYPLKRMTFQMFHMHGDAFTTLYSEVPALLDITHASTINYGTTSLQVTATDSAFIALTHGDQILATGYGSAGGPVTFTVPVLPLGSQIRIVATKRNYFRYNNIITVTTDQLTAGFNANQTSLCQNGSVDFHDNSFGNPVAWSWQFPGGSPSSSNLQNPAGISYSQPGFYDVKLTVFTSNGDSATSAKSAYIQVVSLPIADFTPLSGCLGVPLEFTDLSNPNGGTLTNWLWNFGDSASGPSNISTSQNPVYTYTATGTYPVSLEVTSNGKCKSIKVMEISIMEAPLAPLQPQGTAYFCNLGQPQYYTTTGSAGTSSFVWELEPSAAGTISGNDTIAMLQLNSGFTGDILIKVKGVGLCGSGDFSEPLAVKVNAVPSIPLKPEGPDSVNLNRTQKSVFTVTKVPGATGYFWEVEPAISGTISQHGETAKVTWAPDFRGLAFIKVKSENDCGASQLSDQKQVLLFAPVGINEVDEKFLTLAPNPNKGKFTLEINAGNSTHISIIVVNANGKIVYREANIPVNMQLRKELDLTQLSGGSYFLKVEGVDIQTVINISICK